MHLARLFNLSASSFDLGLSRSRNLIDLDGESLGKLAIAKNLDQRVFVLDDALGLQACAIDDLASFVLLLETANVDREVLNTVDVGEAGELRKATRQRSLATLEAGLLAATGTGLLTVQTTTSGLTLASSMATADALTVLTRADAGCRSFNSI